MTSKEVFVHTVLTYLFVRLVLAIIVAVAQILCWNTVALIVTSKLIRGAGEKAPCLNKSDWLVGN